MTFDKDFLATVTEETLYPLQKVIADAVMIQLNGEAFVGNLVEGFTEVKEHCIYLVAVEAMYCVVRTSWLSQAFPKAVLAVSQYVELL